MSNIKKILEEAQEITDEMQSSSQDDRFASARYSCQSWMLDKMLRITETITNALQRNRQKQK